MNWDQIKGNWTKAKGQTEPKRREFTDDDLKVIIDKRKELAGRVHERFRVEKEEAKK